MSDAADTPAAQQQEATQADAAHVSDTQAAMAGLTVGSEPAQEPAARDTAADAADAAPTDAGAVQPAAAAADASTARCVAHGRPITANSAAVSQRPHTPLCGCGRSPGSPMRPRRQRQAASSHYH
jgi:hypothetical protein